MTRGVATSLGAAAVALWSFLALLTVLSAPVPPFQLNAICFSIAGVVGLVWAWRTGQLATLAQLSPGIYLFGTIGLFGYHAFYFSALRLAPPAQAGLIAYLWPLLIILFSGLLPGEKMRAGHLMGGLLGFGGAAILLMRGTDGAANASTLGLVFAGLCALTWSGYSVMSRRFQSAPTSAVAVYCIASAMLSAAAHWGFESTAWPNTAVGWLSIAGLGFGPVGLAFFVWDIGVKQGDIQLLGAISYAAPLLSTLILIAAGLAQPTISLLAAAAMISAGALVAARSSVQATR